MYLEAGMGERLEERKQWLSYTRILGVLEGDRCPLMVLITFLQNWKKELEKHREKLLSGSESSSKKRQVILFLLYCYP